MKISNYSINDAIDFVSYSDPDDSKIRYTYAKFIDNDKSKSVYAVQVSRHLNDTGGAMEIGDWKEVKESDFLRAKAHKR